MASMENEYAMSPVLWIEGCSEKNLRRTLEGLQKHVESCEKPKCRAFRYFTLAVINHRLGATELARLNDVPLAMDNVQKIGGPVDSELHPVDDAAELLSRKKVLTMLIARFAEQELKTQLTEDMKAALLERDLREKEERGLFHYYKGRFLAKCALYAEARAEFERSSVECPKSTFWLIPLARQIRGFRKSQKDPGLSLQREIEYYQRKLDADPGHPGANVFMVVTLEDKLKVDSTRTLGRLTGRAFHEKWEREILPMVQRAEKATEERGKLTDVDLLTKLAAVYAASPAWLGCRNKARELYYKALQVAPSSAAVHHGLGKFLLVSGDADLGMEHLRLSCSPGAEGWYVLCLFDYLSLMYYRQEATLETIDEEFQLAETNLALDFHQITLLCAWAQSKVLQGEHKKALELLTKAGRLQREYMEPATTKYKEFPFPRWNSGTFLRDKSDAAAWGETGRSAHRSTQNVHQPNRTGKCRNSGRWFEGKTIEELIEETKRKLDSPSEHCS